MAEIPGWNDALHYRELTQEREAQLVDDILLGDESAIEKFKQLFEGLVRWMIGRVAAARPSLRDAIQHDDDLVQFVFVYLTRGLRKHDLGADRKRRAMRTDAPAKTSSPRKVPLRLWIRQTRLKAFVAGCARAYLYDLSRRPVSEIAQDTRYPASKSAHTEGTQRGRLISFVELTEDVSETIEEMDLDDQVSFRVHFERCLEELDPDRRQIVIARLTEGRTLSTMALLTGGAISTVWHKEKQAIDRLKACLREWRPQSAQAPQERPPRG